MGVLGVFPLEGHAQRDAVDILLGPKFQRVVDQAVVFDPESIMCVQILRLGMGRELAQTDATVVISPWGRDYRYGKTLFPTSIKSTRADNLLAGPKRIDVSPLMGHSAESKSYAKLREQWILEQAGLAE